MNVCVNYCQARKNCKLFCSFFHGKVIFTNVFYRLLSRKGDKVLLSVMDLFISLVLYLHAYCTEEYNFQAIIGDGKRISVHLGQGSSYRTPTSSWSSKLFQSHMNLWYSVFVWSQTLYLTCSGSNPPASYPDWSFPWLCFRSFNMRMTSSN